MTGTNGLLGAIAYRPALAIGGGFALFNILVWWTIRGMVPLEHGLAFAVLSFVVLGGGVAFSWDGDHSA